MGADDIKATLEKLQTMNGELDLVSKAYQLAKIDFDRLSLDVFNTFDQKLKDAAMMCAALKGDETAVRFCKANGASFYAYKNTRPILHAVALKGDLKMLQVLLDVGADINLTDVLGMNALQLLLDLPTEKEQKDKRTAVANFLIGKNILGNHVDKKYDGGYDALYYAAKNGYTDVAIALIAAKSWLNRAYPDNTTVLYWAFKNKDLRLKAALLMDQNLDFKHTFKTVNKLRKSIANDEERQVVVDLMVEMIKVCPLDKAKDLDVLRSKGRPEFKQALADYDASILAPKPMKPVQASPAEKAMQTRLPVGYETIKNPTHKL